MTSPNAPTVCEDVMPNLPSFSPLFMVQSSEHPAWARAGPLSRFAGAGPQPGLLTCGKWPLGRWPGLASVGDLACCRCLEVV